MAWTVDTLEKRRQDQDLVTTYKILKGVDDVDKEVWFRQVPEDRTHRTRATEGGHNIVQVTSKTELWRNFFSQRVAERWNELPLKTKNAPSVTSFKASLRGGQHKNQTHASPVKQQLEHQSMNNIGNTSNVQNGEYQYQLNGSDLEISTDLKSRTIPEILPMVLEDH